MRGSMSKEGEVTVQSNQGVLSLSWLWHPVSVSLGCEHADGMCAASTLDAHYA